MHATDGMYFYAVFNSLISNNFSDIYFFIQWFNLKILQFSVQFKGIKYILLLISRYKQKVFYKECRRKTENVCWSAKFLLENS